MHILSIRSGHTTKNAKEELCFSILLKVLNATEITHNYFACLVASLTFEKEMSHQSFPTHLLQAKENNSLVLNVTMEIYSKYVYISLFLYFCIYFFIYSLIFLRPMTKSILCELLLFTRLPCLVTPLIKHHGCLVWSLERLHKHCSMHGEATPPVLQHSATGITRRTGTPDNRLTLLL